MATALDHLILFLPASSNNTPIIPFSLKKAFNLTPGGTHADGLTANTLILLADGCYIELICFLPQENKSKVIDHWWGPDPDRRGWTDWCLTTTTSPGENWQRLKGSHAEPVAGGRKRPDGKDVNWSVTFPDPKWGRQKVRGKIPFFCHDTTPRELRVPVSESSTKHPSEVLGVRSLTVIVASQEDLDKTRNLYSSILGVKGVQTGSEVNFEIGRVIGLEGLKSGPSIILRLPKSDEETKKSEKNGFWYGYVVLSVEAGEGREVGTRKRVDEGEGDVGGIWIEYVMK